MFNRKIFTYLLTYLLTLCLVFIGWFFLVSDIKAGAGHNTAGWSWSKNIGWTSFNNTSGGGASDYGVNIIDNGLTGIFSGYAWSENIGWIDFNEANLTGCPSGTCRAWVDKINGAVYGWAKILSTNDWLRLRGASYGVSISKSTGDFSGWAWGGETLGWMSFNCNQVETGSVCPITNYKVYTSFDMNIKPTVDLSLSLLPTPVSLCTTPAYGFSWIFSDLDAGDAQTQYQLQIDKEGTFADFGAGEVDITVVTSAQSKEVLLVQSAGPGQLAYNTSYAWRIRVWDNHPSSLNNMSDWFYGSNFTTPVHIYPTPNFDWSPKPIIKDQLIQFTDTSECYDASNNKITCSSASFIWTLPPNAEFAEDTNESTRNPIISFKSSGRDQAVSLQVSDGVGSCSTMKNINVTLPLPKWQEILP